jgi:XTP/dITP diphosphohydrolase
MSQRAGMATLLIGTRNAHKLEEIQAILGGEFDYLDLNVFSHGPTVSEDAGTFAGNAIKKSVCLAEWWTAVCSSRAQLSGSERFVLADDSGLEVSALGGAPGVRSARFAASDSSNADNCSDRANNEKLLRLLLNVPDDARAARFRCVIALTPLIYRSGQNSSPVCFANELELHTEIFEGTCAGRIGRSALGEGGFGYDPLFLPDGFEVSFAEIGQEIKNTISHRAQALLKLRQRLLQPRANLKART